MNIIVPAGTSILNNAPCAVKRVGFSYEPLGFMYEICPFRKIYGKMLGDKEYIRNFAADIIHDKDETAEYIDIDGGVGIVP